MPLARLTASPDPVAAVLSPRRTRWSYHWPVDDDNDSEPLGRLVQAIRSLGTDLDLGVILHRLTEAAVDLVGARYGALGVLNTERTALASFITVGLTDEQRAAIGDLPKGHGILGLLIIEPEPIRLADLNQHPESFGFPPNHPPMASFLGVPVIVRGEVFGNLYLTDKIGADEFSDLDEELAIGLAAAAGAAIENARLLARTRDLDIARERERIARDLHDTVIQRLFATGLSLQSAARLTDQPEVESRIQQAIDELDTTVRDIRGSIFELNPPQSASAGLRRRLLDIGDEMAEALGHAPTFRFEGPVDSGVSDNLGPHVTAVVREALSNIAKHAASSTADVLVALGGGEVTVVVDDTGRGPIQHSSGGFGISNLQARANEVGGRFEFGERPGGGTRVRWQAPLLD
jgi:signal transduction histidine kinase